MRRRVPAVRPAAIRALSCQLAPPAPQAGPHQSQVPRHRHPTSRSKQSMQRRGSAGFPAPSHRTAARAREAPRQLPAATPRGRDRPARALGKARRRRFRHLAGPFDDGQRRPLRQARVPATRHRRFRSGSRADRPPQRSAHTERIPTTTTPRPGPALPPRRRRSLSPRTSRSRARRRRADSGPRHRPSKRARRHCLGSRRCPRSPATWGAAPRGSAGPRSRQSETSTPTCSTTPAAASRSSRSPPARAGHLGVTRPHRRHLRPAVACPEGRSRLRHRR